MEGTKIKLTQYKYINNTFRCDWGSEKETEMSAVLLCVMTRYAVTTKVA